MPRLIVIGLVVLLLGGGGAGGWWFGVRGEPVPFLDEAAEAEAETAPAKPETRFIKLRPLAFPVLEEGRVDRLMTLVVAFEVSGPDAGDIISEQRPRIRDAMLSELHALYSLRFVRERDDALHLIKQRLLRAAREIIGPDLHGVYIQTVRGRPQA